MTIKTFNKTTLPQVRTAINSALERVEEELGIDLSIGNMTYEADGSGFRTKLEGRVIGEDGEVVTAEAQDFKDWAWSHGLPEEALGQEITFQGNRYVLTGYSRRSKKYPFLVRRVSDGMGFKLTQASVKRAWEAKQKAAA